MAEPIPPAAPAPLAPVAPAPAEPVPAAAAAMPRLEHFLDNCFRLLDWIWLRDSGTEVTEPAISTRCPASLSTPAPNTSKCTSEVSSVSKNLPLDRSTQPVTVVDACGPGA